MNVVFHWCSHLVSIVDIYGKILSTIVLQFAHDNRDVTEAQEKCRVRKKIIICFYSVIIQHVRKRQY